jgi:hypothetical protein
MNAVFVFDRATYRERLTAVLDAYRDDEPAWLRLRREFFERTPWDGPLGMGLERPGISETGSSRGIHFIDPFWHVDVIVLIGDVAETVEECLVRATRLIAQWQPEELRALWSGPVKPPHYPSQWGRLGSS